MKKESRNFSRRVFIKTTSIGAVAGSAMPSYACGAKKSEHTSVMDVRPHELMLIVAKIGAGYKDDLGDARLTEILRVVRANPSQPISRKLAIKKDNLFILSSSIHLPFQISLL